MMSPHPRFSSMLLLQLLLGLAVLLGAARGGNYSTSYSVLLPNAASVIPNAYGSLSAKVSSDLRLSVLFNLKAKRGSYPKGPVTVSTDAKGRLSTLVKGGQTCTVTYKTPTGTVVKAVKCTGARRRALRSDPEDQEEEDWMSALPLSEHRGLQAADPCDSCVSLAQTAFSAGLAVACASSFPSFLPATSYPWAKAAAATVCGMTKPALLGKARDLAFGTCDCPCAANADCTSRVCSGGFCLPTKIATRGSCPDYEDADCLNGHCARSSYPSGPPVCCATNQYVTSRTMNATYCTLTMGDDDFCDANSMCLSGVCSDGVCLATRLGAGEGCPDYENSDCLNGKCGRESYPSGNPVCCPTGASVYSKLLNETFCTATQLEGQACDQNSMCVSGVCSQNVCLPEAIGTGLDCPDFENSDCLNNVCARIAYPAGAPKCCDSNAAVKSVITNEYYCTLTMGTDQPCDNDLMCFNEDCNIPVPGSPGTCGD